MRILVVYTHPFAGSLAHAALERVLKGLEEGRHEVKIIDLYAEAFDPVLREAEWHDYSADPMKIARGAMRAHVERLEWAEGLVFVHPTWTFGLPAMLKGWLDRVLLPGVSFELPEEGSKAVRSRLRGIKLVGLVTTTGSPWWVMLLAGSPGKKTLMRSIRLGFALRCQRVHVCLHAVDTCSHEKRVAFLKRVERRFSSVR
ncbi:MAG: NAD(P)H-dependent oxidoreductase [Deltaproteobacteria bacterium]|nr:NAD(P)H-dependent oxidoreductase [Deltaproteobacteria bacterium]